jgi:hypothetical protein
MTSSQSLQQGNQCMWISRRQCDSDCGVMLQHFCTLKKWYLSYACNMVSSLILNVQVSRIHCFTLMGRGKAEIHSGPYAQLKNCCTWWHNWEYSSVRNCADNTVCERFACKCYWVVEFMNSHCRVFQQGFCESDNFEFCEDMVAVQKDLFETHTWNWLARRRNCTSVNIIHCTLEDSKYSFFRMSLSSNFVHNALLYWTKWNWAL